MKYEGTFWSLSGKQYTLTFTTEGGSGRREITLGVPPFTTQMDNSEESIYKPLRLQGATAVILTDNETDYLFDLYSGKANGTRVELTWDNDGDNEVAWEGYVTPVLYDNGYTEIHEQLQVECIDGLSILKYYKYQSQDKGIVRFIDVVNKCLEKCGCYGNLYVSNNTKLTQDSNSCILNDLYISEQNFFNKKDKDETDDDVAWTYEEVLSEICQYLGYVAVAYKGDVYFIDYEALKSGVNDYWHYVIGEDTATLELNVEHVTIEPEMYRDGNNTLSLDPVYNKITVADDFYLVDSLYSSFWDNLQNITQATDPITTGSTATGTFGEVVQAEDGNMIVFVDKLKNPEGAKDPWHIVFVKYYTNPDFNFTQQPDELNYSETQYLHGATIAKFCVQKLDREGSWWDSIFEQLTGGTKNLDEFLEEEEVDAPSWTNYIAMFNHRTGHVQPPVPWVVPINSENNCFIGGDNAYLMLKGQYQYHSVDEAQYPINSGTIELDHGDYIMKPGDATLTLKLKWGNLYWNGHQWTITDTTFRLPYINESATLDKYQAQNTMFSDNNFKNTVNWRMGITEKGYVIPVPQGEILAGKPELTIYSPYDPWYTNVMFPEFKYYEHTRVFLKDLDLVPIVGNPTFNEDLDSDTVYTNIIDLSHVQEPEEVSFKICTYDNKNHSYSSVAKKENNKYSFLYNTYNCAWNRNDVQEKHYIQKFCKQYKQPAVRLEVNLNQEAKPWTTYSDKWLNGKLFIQDSVSFDYYNDNATITLVEKF